MSDRADLAAKEVAAGLAAGVKVRRRSLALSQQELADLAGVSVRFIHDLERGKSSVRLLLFLRVLDALGWRLSLEPGRGLLMRAGALGKGMG